MTPNQLIKRICELEGKKKEVTIGNIREVVAAIRKIIQEDPSALTVLVKKEKPMENKNAPA